MKHSEINWARLVSEGLLLVGKPYNFGEEVKLTDRDVAHIKAIDCSELVEWLYYPIGLEMPDGSYNQAKVCREIKAEPEEFPGKLLIGDFAAVQLLTDRALLCESVPQAAKHLGTAGR